ncbi:acetyl-CoA carboxylase biotin carboxyl carrier protein [Paenibacillus thiaminolyticus]|uniref:Biotin carboxyl carrier protein of acetyl-CoA carboxylase n=1 Tax=Paenibacillus thiaminolyticus TaxID=49283 RepID=A0AAP9DRW4_PANTH|nr:acetyl-CoA carboxylase biotin carboxyl carrier protein [Paenibacillus thiaminolyticus]MCY9536337.1 acetyl-CoA carboxylase biotin carboxyl carrier protein [Paenibacillus thiaminolyticus]MCY9601349.1 acetyl-CoA carboxylase biotin carboxyl carrier protein [Paenibacillus thiaminolyticus]MCY9609329.1 acetyl-CoA carboxylase biotin carboxyl carrier protein [Paenibacillus thiaminolyticus]MCY9613004.1 acetyl-CoA carboxylase biotin carboxyl carrier protein [Paenibacillus thiaminolyticus]MCY9617012.1 
MFKISEIKELIKLLDQTSVHELEIENEGCRIAIRKPGKTEVFNVQSAAPLTYPAPAPAAVAAPAEAVTAAAETQPEKKEEQAGLVRIVSPMVGTFYSAPSPESPPYVKAGDKINEKTVVCILEAMKLMNELEAEVKGEIVEVLATNGQLVEFGQPLFLVKPE